MWILQPSALLQGWRNSASKAGAGAGGGVLESARLATWSLIAASIEAQIHFYFLFLLLFFFGGGGACIQNRIPSYMLAAWRIRPARPYVFNPQLPGVVVGPLLGLFFGCLAFRPAAGLRELLRGLSGNEWPLARWFT